MLPGNTCVTVLGVLARLVWLSFLLVEFLWELNLLLEALVSLETLETVNVNFKSLILPSKIILEFSSWSGVCLLNLLPFVLLLPSKESPGFLWKIPVVKNVSLSSLSEDPTSNDPTPGIFTDPEFLLMILLLCVGSLFCPFLNDVTDTTLGTFLMSFMLAENVWLEVDLDLEL